MYAIVNWFVDFLAYVVVGVLFLDILMLLLSIFRRLRKWTGAVILYSSVALGAYLWFWSLRLTWDAWGGFWTLVSVLLLGIGPFITGLLALIFHFHEWRSVGLMVSAYAIAFGVRFLGAFIMHYGEE
jgi:hypothetical protein